MRGPVHTLCLLFDLLGVDLGRMWSALRGIPRYLQDLHTYRKQVTREGSPVPAGRPYPCTGDRYMNSGATTGPYLLQDLHVARRIYENAPELHVDVGSRVDGFVTHVAAFRRIRVLDVRPLGAPIPNVEFVEADFMQPLPDSLVDCCDSLSCLHAIEHFGLGRYGDPVSYNGHLLGFDNLHRCLKRGGTLYLSSPIGPLRVEFNAHRVFSLEYLLGLLKGKYEIRQFSFIDDAGVMHENVSLDSPDARNNFGCRFGCGIAEMTKL